MAKGFRRTWNGRLKVIEQFGREVAQKVVGGVPTTPNHTGGDLYHAVRNAFSEVKASGEGGAIIREVQLQQHCDDLDHVDRDYVLVFYESRKWSGGRHVCLPMRIGKTQAKLRKFLIEHVQKVYVLHISIIWAFYRAHPELVKTHQMKEGPRRLFKLRSQLVERLVKDSLELPRLGLDPALYEITQERKWLRLDGRTVQIEIGQILSKPLVDDLSFNIEEFDRTIVV